jgi:Na+/H+ antiporter NhaD/arsenite permease-like protein
VLLAIGGLLLALGVLPIEQGGALVERVWPILLFVVAITIVTELAAEAGLFRSIAHRAARAGLGRAWVLWIIVVLIAVTSTIFLSLDTTAVLLTPVVVLLARHVGISPVPFALTTVWLANTGSLLLPVSNLTNLLAQHSLNGMSPAAFASLMVLPAVAAVVVPCLVLFLVFRRELLVPFHPEQPQEPGDRVLLVVSIVVVGLLVPALVSGVPVWMPASAGAVILLGFFALRRREALRFSLVPWQIVLLASGLFLVVEAGHALGLGAALTAVAGTGDDALSLFRLAASGAIGSNLIDNLPAYLALEPVAGSATRTAALLIGTNAGPLITPWASLATLLWHARLASLGVEIPWGRYALLGLLVVPLTIVAAVLLLALR